MPENQDHPESFILFELDGATYGIRSRHVRQLDMVEHITPVPKALPFVEGVVFIRGQVIPAISLRARFGFEKIPYSLRTRLIVVQAGSRTVGLLVDTAREFVLIKPETILPPPEEVSGLSGKYLEGIARFGERLVLVLDLGEVLKFTGNERLGEDIELSPADHDSAEGASGT